jgi:hypothetical protein
MQNNKETKYRVFDSKDNYQQTYSAKLNGAFSWARDCAKRVNGYVVEIQLENDKHLSEEVVFTTKGK